MYYPYTPTAGCLSTKEIWDASGKCIFSDQQKLANAVKKAGGANGYLIVLELDDAQKIITPEERIVKIPIKAIENSILKKSVNMPVSNAPMT